MGTRKQKRLPPGEARSRILKVAHEFFLKGGADAIKVQLIAKELGITDAAIHYHFKNREKLLEALLSYGGQQLQESINTDMGSDLPSLAKKLNEIYDKQQFSRLAMWLSMAGWRSEKSGMFNAAAEHWQQLNQTTALEAKYQIAFLNMVLAAEPLLAGAYLRSVDLPDDEAARRKFHRWFIAKLKRAFSAE